MRNYGGAYDIGEYDYFTKEEIVEFAEAVAEEVSIETGVHCEVVDVYMEITDKAHNSHSIKYYDKPGVQVLIIELEFKNWTWGSIVIEHRIDMRRIRKPSDLFKAYLNMFVDDFVKTFNDWSME